MKSNHLAILTRDCPIADLFPDGVPVQTMVPVRCDLIGLGAVPCYLIDAERCDSGTTEELCRRVAEMQNCRPADVREQLLEQGFPIREQYVGAMRTHQGPGISTRFLV